MRVTAASIILATAETDSTPAGPANVGLGAFVLIVVIGAFLIWVGYLIINSRRVGKKKADETPPNLQPYLSDDELENRRLTKILTSAVVAAGVLALLIPVYYIIESDRQAEAAEAQSELYIEEGHRWYTNFVCTNCHGADGGGGGAAYTEERSGLETSWAVPSLNDVFYRYSEEEVEFWVVYGRAGTPMPANGLEGGGAMSTQEVDQVMAFIESFQISQGDALAKIQPTVDAALARIAGGAEAVAARIAAEQAVIADLNDAPAKFETLEQAGATPTNIAFILAGDGTCTDESAAMVGSSCNQAGLDTDRDGISDEAERLIAGSVDGERDPNSLAAITADTVVVRVVSPVEDDDGNITYEVTIVPNVGLYPHLYDLMLDPSKAFTMTDAAGVAIADIDSLDAWMNDLSTAHLTLGVVTERQEVFLNTAVEGLNFLRDAEAEQLWAVDFDEVAANTGLSVADSERAVGLFNGYCARCHTAGYSAGVAFEQEAGSGAWGPSLVGGASVSQFPNADDQVKFIIEGSELARNYGVNGIGNGWMPAFGQILSEEDIRLIVQYERSM